jgi:hypothetical protein
VRRRARGKCTRRVNVTARLGVGCDRGVAAGNAAEPGPAPWVTTSRASAVGTRVCVRGSGGGKRVRGGQGSGVSPPFATVCARYPATARLWRRGRPKHGGESRRKRKGPKVQPCPRGRRARVLGCTLARGCRDRVATRANANASANGTARRRGREWHGTAYDCEKNRLGQRASVHRRRQRHLQMN